MLSSLNETRPVKYQPITVVVMIPTQGISENQEEGQTPISSVFQHGV